jgi:hypothetical protein
MFFTVFLPALLWGLCILASLAGWGRLLASAFRRNPPSPASPLADWLDAPAWGIAATSVLGGLLNLGSLANPSGLVLYVLAGLALFIYSATRSNLPHRLRAASSDTTRANRPFLALLIFVAALLALRFASSVIVASFHTNPHFAAFRFNPQDDMQSYLVTVERLLQTGSLGLDPFNSRLMMTGFGTQHFLNALVVAFLPLDHLHLLEGGIGLAALCFATASLGLRLELGRFAATALVLIPLAVDCSYINLTSSATSAAVLTAFVSCLIHPPPASANLDQRFPYLLLAGLLFGGACSLKSTSIPVAVLFVVVATLLQAVATRRVRPLTDAFLFTLIAIASLLPWMLWQYQSSGTALYPLLGRGFQWEVYFPTPPLPYSDITQNALATGLVLPSGLLLGSMAILLFRKGRDAAGVGFSLLVAAFLLAWTVSWPILAYSTENPSASRYLATPREVGLLLFLALSWRIGQRMTPKPRWLSPRLTGPVTLLVLLICLWPEWSVTYLSTMPRDLASSLPGRLHPWTAEIAQTRALQAPVPPGQKLLAYLSTPFLLDFRRNQVFVADWPGESSPPPGLPVRSGAKAVADYLQGQGIRYLAYSYGSKAGFAISEHPDYLYFDFGHVIHRTTVNAIAFQKDLGALAQTCPHVFDDGQTFVLDIATPGKANPSAK